MFHVTRHKTFTVSYFEVFEVVGNVHYPCRGLVSARSVHAFVDSPRGEVRLGRTFCGLGVSQCCRRVLEPHFFSIALFWPGLGI